MTTVSTIAYPSLSSERILSYAFPVPALLSLKAAGEMGASGGPLSEARQSLLNEIGVPRERFVSLHQVHSRSVHVADADTYGADGDGMISSNRNLCLGITVADCMPIFLYDRASGAYGLLHSGWRGTGIAVDAVRQLNNHFDSEPAELTALLGPCIGVCCYRVDEERASLFSSRWGKASAVKRDGDWYLDMRQANIGLLRNIGVSQVIDAHICTACHSAFASYRREGPQQYTGMVALLGKLKVPADAVRLSASGMEHTI